MADDRRGVTAVDLFAGAGGWDEGIRPLGIQPLGVELDPDACATPTRARDRPDAGTSRPGWCMT